MPYADLVYSNARIKALENNLITSDRLSRILNAESISDAVKVLSEVGYGNGVVIQNPNRYELLIKAEDDKLVKFLQEVIPEKGGLEILLYDQDAKNLKSCMKLKYSKTAKKEELLRVSGTFDIDEMYDSIMQDNYNMFPKPIAKALVDIDYEFALGQKRPAFIDFTIEKAINELCLELLKNKGSKEMKEFYKLSVEFTNFATFIRARRLKLPQKIFSEMFLQGGETELSVFEKNYDQSLDQVQDIFRYKTAGKVFVNAINELKEHGSLIVYEKERDDFLVSLFIDERNEIFSVGPMVSYYLIKRLEMRMVRLAIVNLNNKLDKQEFKKRLRACFNF